jgi:hypothetical protein
MGVQQLLGCRNIVALDPHNVAQGIPCCSHSSGGGTGSSLESPRRLPEYLPTSWQYFSLDAAVTQLISPFGPETVKLAPDVTEVRLELQQRATGRGEVFLELFLGRSQLLHKIFPGFPIPSSVIALRAVSAGVLLGCSGPGELVVTLANQVDARTLPLAFSRLEIALGFLAASLPREELFFCGVQSGLQSLAVLAPERHDFRRLIALRSLRGSARRGAARVNAEALVGLLLAAAT